MKNKNEGTCGHGPGGKLGKTPGGTKGMPAYKRTNDMLRKFIREELKNITEHHKDEDFPEQEKPVNYLLNKIEKKDQTLYKQLEKFIQNSIQQEIARLKEINLTFTDKTGEHVIEVPNSAALGKMKAQFTKDPNIIKATTSAGDKLK